jgi:hypothetical protein
MIFTPEQLEKELNSNNEVLCVALELLLLKEEHKQIAQRVDAYRKKIIEEMKPVEVETGKLITDISRDWLMSDEQFQIYADRCDEEKEKAGFKGIEAGYCPKLIAESKIQKAERKLVDIWAPKMDLSAENLATTKYELYREFIELTLNLISDYLFNHPAKQRMIKAFVISKRAA